MSIAAHRYTHGLKASLSSSSEKSYVLVVHPIQFTHLRKHIIYDRRGFHSLHTILRHHFGEGWGKGMRDGNQSDYRDELRAESRGRLICFNTTNVEALIDRATRLGLTGTHLAQILMIGFFFCLQAHVSLHRTNDNLCVRSRIGDKFRSTLTQINIAS